MPSAATIEILLVEDDEDEAQFMEDALSEGTLNLHITRVYNGVDALDLLHRRGKYAEAPLPDLILLDLVLPKVTGHEVLQDVKKDPSLRRIPIVILSSGSAEQFRQAYDLHANCCVPKPIDQEEFARAVKMIEQFWLNNPHRK